MSDAPSRKHKSVRDIAATYLSWGWAPIPVERHGKRPIGEDWPNRRLDSMTIPAAFADGVNIGVLLGEPSGWLVDVDCDAPAAVALAADYLPETHMVFGRPAKPRSHWLYRAQGAVTVNFEAPGGGMLAELRSTGRQTVFPGSVHESGERIAWADGCDTDKITAIAPWDLRAAVMRLAAAGLLAHNWNEGTRHAATLALSGALRRAGWGREAVATFLEPIFNAFDDPKDHDDRLAAIHTTFARPLEAETTGWPTAAKLFGEDTVAALRAWLPPPTKAEAPKPLPLSGSGRTWRSVSTFDLRTSEDVEVDWVLVGLIARGELALMTAPPKVGKSWVGQAIAIAAACGRIALGRFQVERPYRVLLGDEEMGERKIARRLKRLVQGMRLTPSELQLLDENLLTFPQQGITLRTAEERAMFFASVKDFRPDLIILDSFAAFTVGFEDDNVTRRQFYTQVLAPLKGKYGAAVLLLAHPPLPGKDVHADAHKRPRGGGDVLGVADRALYIERIGSERTEFGERLTGAIGQFMVRELGGLETPAVLTVEDVAHGGTVVRVSESTEASTDLVKSGKCQIEILHRLRSEPSGWLYQTDLIAELEACGFSKRHAYRPAVKALKELGAVRIAFPAEASPELRGERTGRWLVLTAQD